MDQKKSTVLKNWVLVIQLGLTVIAPIVLCVGLGVYLKQYQEMDLLLPLCIIGILAGASGAWRQAIRHAGKDNEETRLLSGIYDRSPDLNAADDEDPLLEEYRRNNEEREK